jgi:hypothetical protein
MFIRSNVSQDIERSSQPITNEVIQQQSWGSMSMGA